MDRAGQGGLAQALSQKAERCAGDCQNVAELSKIQAPQVPSAVARMSRTLNQNNKEEPDPVTSKEAVSPDIRATPRFGLMPARYGSRTVLGVGPFVLSRWDPEHQGTTYGGGSVASLPCLPPPRCASRP